MPSNNLWSLKINDETFNKDFSPHFSKDDSCRMRRSLSPAITKKSLEGKIASEANLCQFYNLFQCWSIMPQGKIKSSKRHLWSLHLWSLRYIYHNRNGKGEDKDSREGAEAADNLSWMSQRFFVVFRCKIGLSNTYKIQIYQNGHLKMFWDWDHSQQ